MIRHNKPRNSPVLASVLPISLLYSFFSYAVFQNVFEAIGGILLLSFIIFVPFILGTLIAYYPPAGLQQSKIYAFLAPLGIFLLFTGVVAIFLEELLFCILIASPIILIGSLLGSYFGRKTRDKKPPNDDAPGGSAMMMLVLLALPFMSAPLELLFVPETAVYTVETSITITADSDTVWQNIIRVPEIQPDEQSRSWFHFLGVPRPLEATLDGEGVGSLRVGYFEDGLAFRETVTEWQPNQRIAFSVEPQYTTETLTALRQVGAGVYDIRRATYRIEPLADGRVTLHLQSEYSLTSHLNGYGRFWFDPVMADFQSYVLEIVKQRSESPTPNS